jgi:hypothetical protein
VASISISEPSLIDARNRLKQLGLIDFQPGKRKEYSPVYTILYLNRLSINRVQALAETVVETEEKPPPLKTETKQETKPKPKKTSKSHSGKPVETFPFWKQLVEVWFTFHVEKFTEKPLFTEKNAIELKRILKALKKMSEEKMFEWTEDYSKKVFIHFLTKGFNQSQWLKDNFHLHNLYNQYNSIINPTNDGTKQHLNGFAKNGKIDNTGIQTMCDGIDRKYGKPTNV